MAHKHGAYLGGIRTVEDVRLRCVVDDCTGCWRMRRSDGTWARPDHNLHAGPGKKSLAARVTYELAYPGRLKPGWVVWRHCDSEWCLNPLHLRSGTKAQWGQHVIRRGIYKTPAKVACGRAAGRARRLLSDELITWLMESEQGHTEAAHGLGITPSRAQQIRAKAKMKRSPAASVFDFAAFIDQRRAA